MKFCLFSSKGCEIIDAFLWLFLVGKRAGLSELRNLPLKSPLDHPWSPGKWGNKCKIIVSHYWRSHLLKKHLEVSAAASQLVPEFRECSILYLSGVESLVFPRVLLTLQNLSWIFFSIWKFLVLKGSVFQRMQQMDCICAAVSEGLPNHCILVTSGGLSSLPIIISSTYSDYSFSVEKYFCQRSV